MATMPPPIWSDAFFTAACGVVEHLDFYGSLEPVRSTIHASKNQSPRSMRWRARYCIHGQEYAHPLSHLSDLAHLSSSPISHLISVESLWAQQLQDVLALCVPMDCCINVHFNPNAQRLQNMDVRFVLTQNFTPVKKSVQTMPRKPSVISFASTWKNMLDTAVANALHYETFTAVELDHCSASTSQIFVEAAEKHKFLRPDNSLTAALTAHKLRAALSTEMATPAHPPTRKKI